MLTQHIALVPEASGVDLGELARVSAALQKQVTRDLAPLWGVSATVDAFHALEDVPVGYWPIVLSQGELRREAGVHVDRNGQPYAQVGLSRFWSLEASRACLEMLINPFGDRTTTGSSPREEQGLVEFLVEICGPCAPRTHGYAINGIFVSDFCTPAYYGASTSGGRRDAFSFHGSLRAAWQLVPGGYLTWHDSPTNSWWMRMQPGLEPIDVQLGHVTPSLASARALAQHRGPDRGWGGTPIPEAFNGALVRIAAQTKEASQQRALRLRSLLGERMQEALMAQSYRATERAGLALPEDAALWIEPARIVPDRNTLLGLPEAQSTYTLTDAENAEWAHDEETITQIARKQAHLYPATGHTLQGQGPTDAQRVILPPPPLPASRESRPVSEVIVTETATPFEHAPQERVPTSPSMPAPAMPPPASTQSARPIGMLGTLPPARDEQPRPWLGYGALAAAAVFAALWLGRGRQQVTTDGHTPLNAPAAAVAAPAPEPSMPSEAPLAQAPTAVEAAPSAPKSKAVEDAANDARAEAARAARHARRAATAAPSVPAARPSAEVEAVPQNVTPTVGATPAPGSLDDLIESRQ